MKVLVGKSQTLHKQGLPFPLPSFTCRSCCVVLFDSVEHFNHSTAYILFTFALGQITDTFEGGVCINITKFSKDEKTKIKMLSGLVSLRTHTRNL